MSITGAKTPDATPSTKEREAAARDLERVTQPSTVFGVVAGSLIGSVAFGLLLLPLFGLFVLVYVGLTKLFLGDTPWPEGDAQPVVRALLVGLVVIWPALFVGFSLRSWRREVVRSRRVAAGERPPRTVATFRSLSFNTTEEKESFVNPGCFGDDVVQALVDGLAEDGYEVDPEPGAEDFGWFGRFQYDADDVYDLIVTFQPIGGPGDGVWWVHVARSGTPLSSNFRRRGGEVQTEAAVAVHDVLARHEAVAGLRWFFDGPSAEAALAA